MDIAEALLSALVNTSTTGSSLCSGGNKHQGNAQLVYLLHKKNSSLVYMYNRRSSREE